MRLVIFMSAAMIANQISPFNIYACIGILVAAIACRYMDYKQEIG